VKRLTAITVLLLAGQTVAEVRPYPVSTSPPVQATRPTPATQAAPPASGPLLRSWPVFRGDPAHTGVGGTLPAELVERWKFQPTDAILSSAAIVGGVVFVGSDDSYLYALNLADGGLKWKCKAKGAIQSSPAVVHDLVIFGDQEGTLHACTVATGEQRWSFDTGGEIISSVTCPHPERADDDAPLVFGSYDGFLYCLRARDGGVLWKYHTEDRVHGTPAIVGAHVFVAGCDAHMHVVGLADGAAVRQVPLGSVCGASVAIDGARAFVGTYGGQMLALDWQRGDKLWTWTDTERELPVLSSAALADGLVIVGGRDKRVRAFERDTGQVRWEFITKGKVDSSPVVSGEKVFFGSADGNLYAVDVRRGKELWRFEAGASITASPAIADGCLVIGSHDGIVRCFGARRAK
jgi:eukaryotic-like serine/threonine-protein kinase